MDYFHRIYSTNARAYEAMIAAEDVDGNLTVALRELVARLPASGARVLDLGTGTGRLPRLLAPLGAHVIGLDLHAAMLDESGAQRQTARKKWDLVRGDMRALPFAEHAADVVTAGWAIGHLCGWYPETWRGEIGRVLDEMHRAAAPGGAIIILETLTTGAETPSPPTDELAEYYLWLERVWGFRRQSIRTDYQFENVEAAVAHMEFFFGGELADLIRENGWARVPEWTGVWSKRV